MSDKIRVAALTLLLGGALLGAAPTRAQTAASDNTSPYRHVYEMSQEIFDKCDDPARGDLYRKVVTEKVARCPFSDPEKAEFQAWALTQNARIASEDRQAHAAGPVPATASDIRRCTQLAGQPEMRDVRRRLDRYGRGQIAADGVIEEACRPMQP